MIAGLALATAGRRVGEVVTDCAACPPMVVVPAKLFQTGSNDGEADEKPVHRVDVPAFLPGRTEVTQGRWRVGGWLGLGHRRSGAARDPRWLVEQLAAEPVLGRPPVDGAAWA